MKKQVSCGLTLAFGALGDAEGAGVCRWSRQPEAIHWSWVVSRQGCRPLRFPGPRVKRETQKLEMLKPNLRNHLGSSFPAFKNPTPTHLWVFDRGIIPRLLQDGLCLPLLVTLIFRNAEASDFALSPRPSPSDFALSARDSPPGKRLLDAIQGCIPSLATFAANLFAGDKPWTLGYIRCEFIPMDKPEVKLITNGFVGLRLQLLLCRLPPCLQILLCRQGSRLW